MSTSDPAIPPISSDPSTINTGAAVPTAAARTGLVTSAAASRADQQGDQTEPVGDGLPGPGGQSVPEQQSERGSGDHGEHVHDGAEAGKHR